ncbi:MAG: hypothetical protein LBH43_21325 [Treponema sp.]|jgi:hypothetical protein|nr:hypothetical protein [Treponema sp.]
MKKYILIAILPLLCVACKAQEKNKNAVAGIETAVKQEESGYTFEEFRTEFKRAFEIYEAQIGVYFWDEFKDLEVRYNLTDDESKLLGKWMNVTYTNLTNNYYTFYPNKLFILSFSYENIKLADSEKVYFNKAVGTWGIAGGIVRITIYAIVTADDKLDWPNNKGAFLVERPYTVDFIHIDDIGKEGYTKRPINDTVLSEELGRMATVIEPNRTNNLYVRNVHTIDFITDSGKPEKNYDYFKIVPDLARENISGLDVATNPELIEKYIFPLRP